MPKQPPLRFLPLYLEPDLYDRLEGQAQQNDREVTQQARSIIRRALTEQPTHGERACQRCSWCGF